VKREPRLSWAIGERLFDGHAEGGGAATTPKPMGNAVLPTATSLKDSNESGGYYSECNKQLKGCYAQPVL
jgi:hypothetical protein